MCSITTIAQGKKLRDEWNFVNSKGINELYTSRANESWSSGLPKTLAFLGRGAATKRSKSSPSGEDGESEVCCDDVSD